MHEQLTASKRVLSGAAIALVIAGCADKQTDAEAPAPSPATSSSPAEGDQMGYDVSWPQGGKNLPKDPLFAIVGLNHDVANDWNEYFGEQIAWAQTAEGTDTMPPASIYVHTANPGSKQASKWPTSGENRYGSCEGDDSLSCDYAYGVMLAEDDLAQAAKYDADDLSVWLDVEVENYSWQKNQARNRAAMEGMIKTFTDHGNGVGLYSNAESWQQITGEIPADSELNGLPNWVLGADNIADARANCQTIGFTGQVVLAQIADNVHIDRNLIC